MYRRVRIERGVREQHDPAAVLGVSDERDERLSLAARDLPELIAELIRDRRDGRARDREERIVERVIRRADGRARRLEHPAREARDGRRAGAAHESDEVAHVRTAERLEVGTHPRHRPRLGGPIGQREQELADQRGIHPRRIMAMCGVASHRTRSARCSSSSSRSRRWPARSRPAACSRSAHRPMTDHRHRRRGRRSSSRAPAGSPTGAPIRRAAISCGSRTSTARTAGRSRGRR